MKEFLFIPNLAGVVVFGIHTVLFLLVKGICGEGAAIYLRPYPGEGGWVVIVVIWLSWIIVAFWFWKTWLVTIELEWKKVFSSYLCMVVFWMVVAISFYFRPMGH